ncbi:MAG: hypothetical protein ACO32J_09595 [Phycisphaerales bacterium]
MHAMPAPSSSHPASIRPARAAGGLIATITAFGLLAAAPLPAAASPDDTLILGCGNYLIGDQLVQVVNDSIYWRGGSAHRMGNVVVGSDWESFPGGRAVLVSRLLDAEPECIVEPAWRRPVAPCPRPWFERVPGRRLLPHTGLDSGACRPAYMRQFHWIDQDPL